MRIVTCVSYQHTVWMLERRYQLDQMSLHTLLFVTNFLYMSRPSPRVRALAAPLLAALRPGKGATAVGLHVRMGDASLANGAAKNNDRRYPPKCVCHPSLLS